MQYLYLRLLAAQSLKVRPGNSIQSPKLIVSIEPSMDYGEKPKMHDQIHFKQIHLCKTQRSCPCTYLEQ